MTLCQDTRYLLLDEPLNSLDLQHGVAILRKLCLIALDQGRTVVVLHDLHVAGAFADRVIAMQDGGIFGNGSAEIVLNNDLLSELYRTAIRVERVNGRPLPIAEMGWQ